MKKGTMIIIAIIVLAGLWAMGAYNGMVAVQDRV